MQNSSATELLVLLPYLDQQVAPQRREKREAALIERYHRDWLIPIGGPGWSRCFGLFDKDGSVRGEAGIRSMKLPSQMHRAEIWIGLESEFRGQGLGEKLLRHLIEWAALSTTLAWIDLGVFAENYGARRLYQQLGFKETGRTVDMFRVDQVRIDNIAMVFDLNQYRLELS